MMRLLLCLVLFTLPLQARNIDALIDSKVKKRPPLMDDLAFFRRLMLVAGGRIPTLEEIQAYEKMPSAVRKKRWVEKILNSEAHVSHQYNYWADVLRVPSKFQGIQIAGATNNYREWIKTALRENRPFDEIVRGLIGAKGNLFEEGNGAVGYYLRDKGMPLDNMSNTMRIFAGTRMECAQCHDHPFDKWKQKEFYHLAAFTHSSFMNMGTRPDQLRPLQEDFKKMRGKNGQRSISQAEFQAIKRVRDMFGAGLGDSGSAVIPLSKDYAYDDAAPGQIITAATPMGPTVKGDPQKKSLGKKAAKRFRNKPERMYEDVNSRSEFSEWLTSPDHPRFTRVIVNRIWKQAFGKAITEPLDDIKEDTVSQHPELEKFLMKRMVDLKYDLRAFWSEILLSKAFSREEVSEDVTTDAPFDFRAPLTRRMSGSAWWDSLMALVNGPGVDTHLTKPASFNHIYEEVMNDPDKSVEKVRAFVDMAKSAERGTFNTWLQYRAKVSDMDIPDKEKDKIKKELDAALKLDGNGFDKKITAIKKKVVVNLSEEDSSMMMMSGKQRRQKMNSQRRSEINDKLYGGHFVRTFGGSDRETIEASNTQASIPQALRLLNGSNEGRLLSPTSYLGKILKDNAKKPPKVKTEIIFLSILGRRPTSAETNMILQDVQKRRQQAMADWVWVLLNSHEFRKV